MSPGFIYLPGEREKNKKTLQQGLDSHDDRDWAAAIPFPWQIFGLSSKTKNATCHPGIQNSMRLSVAPSCYSISDTGFCVFLVFQQRESTLCHETQVCPLVTKIWCKLITASMMHFYIPFLQVLIIAAIYWTPVGARNELLTAPSRPSRLPRNEIALAHPSDGLDFTQRNVESSINLRSRGKPYEYMRPGVARLRSNMRHLLPDGTNHHCLGCISR